ncbi:MAG: homoserine kinase [Alistipes sp.]|nr:homoserine kinase [Alistipes sp.]
MRTVKIFAPATVANLGCGFDVAGMAIDSTGDVLEVGVEPGSGLSLENASGVELPPDIEDNVTTPAVRALLAAYVAEEGGCDRRVHITILKKILPGSGIGSSAASSAAAVYGLNELLGRPFTPERLVEFAMEGESLIGGGARHADNVGPAILGGVVLIRGYEPLDIVQLPVPGNFYASVVRPHITVTTKEGRGVLPREIPLRTAVTQWGNVGGLVAGLALGDIDLVGRSMCDAVAEPVRKRFIPGYDELKAGLFAAGAAGANIAGSGPAVFAVCDTAAGAERICEVMSRHFDVRGIPADVYSSKISNRGTRIIAN